MDEAQKLPFDIDRMLDLIRAAVQPFPKAALFELYEDGFTTPFEQLVACMISIRTLDEVTLPTARRLFTQARTPAEVARMSVAEIDALIHASSFHERKAAQIRALAQRVQDEFGGALPCNIETMMSFDGVGLKCANLAAGIACGVARVSADVHVHRITVRWGYITARTPESAGQILEAKLPERYRIEINRLLVPFGKHICTGRRPHCSTCPVLLYCRQVGVEALR